MGGVELCAVKHTLLMGLGNAEQSGAVSRGARAQRNSRIEAAVDASSDGGIVVLLGVAW